MPKETRRQLLAFFGASAGTAVLAPGLGQKQLLGGMPVLAQGRRSVPLRFTPVRLPHPLPIYQQQSSFLATGVGGSGQTLPPSENAQLESFTALDDVIVPPEYERYIILRWGDRVFPNQEEYFGYNCDYTAFIPSSGRNSNDGYLWVNHEYNSYPISQVAPESPADLAGFPSSFSIVIGFDLPADKSNLLTLGEFMYTMGGSTVRIRRQGRAGQFAPAQDPRNRRIHGLSGLGINRERQDNYRDVTSWGPKSYQQGNEQYLVGTGPAAREVFPLSSDGLGNRIIGTAYNCSGGTTPWGTVLSAEENFQGSSTFFVGVTEAVKPNGTQTDYIQGTTGAVFGLVGEKYGWIVEVDPANPEARPQKHTALGRYRHENIAFRVQPGQPLIAYLGDDRRGGHTYKFVSRGTVSNPGDKKNSALFEQGTLYVARYNADGTGQWLPLELNAPTNPIPPSVLASVELERLGQATLNGQILLPARTSIQGSTKSGLPEGGSFVVNLTNEQQFIPQYSGKRLSDFYTSQGAVLVDAFLTANLIGATPTARPEDIEVHPRTNEVFIAYTDGAPGSDGYPDSRIFIVSKYSPAINAAQPSGSIFKIAEASSDGTGTNFRWERLEKGGGSGC